MSLKRILAEPLVHFLLLGMCIFLLNSLFNSSSQRPDSIDIVVDDNDIDRLVTQYKQVWNEEPSPATIKKLIDQYVHSEVMYREALALKLDHNDEIIKRRLKQKYEFLIKDMITTNQVSDEDLQAYYADHSSDFSTEKSYSFYQFYFSPDKRTNPLSDASEFIQSHRLTSKSVIPNLPPADLSHLKQHYTQLSIQQIRQEFGQDFADAFQDINAASWYGPISSGFGIHVLYIVDVQLSRIEDFDQVKDQVLEAFEKDLIQQYNETIYDSVLENYSINIDLDKWASINQ